VLSERVEAARSLGRAAWACELGCELLSESASTARSRACRAAKRRGASTCAASSRGRTSRIRVGGGAWTALSLDEERLSGISRPVQGAREAGARSRAQASQARSRGPSRTRISLSLERDGARRNHSAAQLQPTHLSPTCPCRRRPACPHSAGSTTTASCGGRPARASTRACRTSTGAGTSSWRRGAP